VGRKEHFIKVVIFDNLFHTYGQQKSPSAKECDSRKCDLCLAEKRLNVLAGPCKPIGKKIEIMLTCRHRYKVTETNI